MKNKMKIINAVLLLLMLILAFSPFPGLAAPENQGEDLREKADVLYKEGLALVDQGDWQGAIHPFEEALSIFQEIGEQNGEGVVLSHLGTIHQVLKNYQQALDYYNEALEVIRKIGDRKWEGDVLNTIGMLYYSLREYKHSMNYFQQELTVRQDIDDRDGEVQALLNIGVMYYRLGQDQQAYESLQEGLAIQQTIGNKAGEGETLYSIGTIYSDLGQYSQALEAFRQAELIWHGLSEKANEAKVLNDIGFVYQHLGQYAQAMDYYQKALAISEEIGDPAKEATALINIGGIYHDLGQYSQALEHHNKGLIISQETGRRDAEAAAYNGIGLVYGSLGQYELALDYLQQALHISQEIGNREMEGRTWGNMGGVYFDLGGYLMALENQLKALNILQEIGDRVGEAASLNEIGLIEQKAGRQQQALEYFEDAQMIWQDLGDRVGEARALHNIGSAYMGLQQYTQALDNYQQALAIRRENGERAGEASVLNNIGSTYYYLEDYPQALENFQQALTILEEIGERSWEGETLSNIGFVYEQQEDYVQAINYYKKSIEVSETIQGEIKVEELKASFLDEQFANYALLIGLLWDEGGFEEALNYAERARARAFLDQLAGDTLDFRAGADARMLEREQALKAEIAALHNQLVTLQNGPRDAWDPDEIAVVESRLTDEEAAYARLLTEIKLQSPEVASLVSVDVASLSDVQKLLQPNTTLVEYFVTKNRTLAFIITARTFETVTIDVKREDLEKDINTFRDFASLDDPHPITLQRLYTWLIAPLRDKLQSPIIGIIPHGILHYLPFAALTDGARFLGDDYSLFTLPSASALRFIEQNDKPDLNTILALANSTATEPGLGELKYVKQEAELVARIFGTQPLVNQFATESGLRAQASTANIVHIAAHGQYNRFNPLFSVIYLSPDQKEDGRLEVHEIYGLDLTQTTNLVVLSACETQKGEASRGDEIVGMSRALLYAGTPTVIASLWKVDDKATTLLMERFYTHLQDGMSKARALQQAQSEVREQYPHPYYWSAFVLTGDPGTASAVTTGTSWLKNSPVLWTVGVIGALLIVISGAMILRKRLRKVES